jgi:hypothetical protein
MFGPRFLLSFALAGLWNVQIASANEISYSEDRLGALHPAPAAAVCRASRCS